MARRRNRLERAEPYSPLPSSELTPLFRQRYKPNKIIIGATSVLANALSKSILNRETESLPSISVALMIPSRWVKSGSHLSSSNNHRCPIGKSHLPPRVHFDLSSSSELPTASLISPMKVHAASLANSWDISGQALVLLVSLPDSENYSATRYVFLAVILATRPAGTGWLRSSGTV